VSDNKEEIIRSIDNYIRTKGGNYSEWFLGTCEDPQEIPRCVRDAEGHSWMYLYVGSPEMIREILDHFVKLGTSCQARRQGCYIGIVYVYKKAKG
jgi:hypothetical protein